MSGPPSAGRSIRAGGEDRWRVLEAVLGRRPADLAVVNARIVDVYLGSVSPGGVAIVGERIARTGDVDSLIGDSTTVLDAGGRFVTPGLIETHAHLYHANLSPTEYARLCLRSGTTTVVEAFYGLAQVSGLEAVRFFLAELRRTPIAVLFQVPILAYLQNIELGLAPTPTGLSESDMLETLDWPDCVGLEEPPYIPFRERDPGIERIAAESLARGLPIMGHGAGLDVEELGAYTAMGITADHECVAAGEAVERIRAGMMVSLRECAISHDQPAVQRAITERAMSSAHFMFSTDVPDAVTMARQGHIDDRIRIAVAGGIDPIAAVQMATVNAARYYRVEESLGSLAPGRLADVLVVEDLDDFVVRDVIAKGERVIAGGEEVALFERPIYPQAFLGSLRIKRPVRAEDLRIAVPDGRDQATVRVIAGAELLSEERHMTVPCPDGHAPADTGQDVLKAAMVDRFGRHEAPALGFIHGYGLKRGAIGTAYNPFTNNPMALGTNDADVAHAINEVAEMQGGFVAVAGGEVLASVPLPLCGLLSDQDADDVVRDLERLYAVVAELGCPIERPFHQLAFTGVAGELPRLKLSDRGMFDVERRQLVSPLVE
jgi:adenine deaminase